MSRDLLLEIGTEELPAGFIGDALAQMHTRSRTDLARLRLSHERIETYGTPRRLAVLVRGVAERQADLLKETKGPSERVAFAEDGTPTRAAEGFARGQGVDVTELDVRDTEQGKYVFAVTREEGLPTAEVLKGWLPDFVTALQFPKSMRWGWSALRFARPLRWLVALLGDEVLPFAVDSVQAGAVTFGHRFLAPQAIVLSSADAYVARLRDGRVLADVAERKTQTAELVDAAAKQVGGLVVDDGSLLEEVANLIEYPGVVVGRFADEYLALPDEVLMTPMREHQRYFPLANEAGTLLPRFVAVSNGPRPDPDIVRQGNEKVLAARLADARFFYEEDRKRPLRDYVELLRNVVFQQKLGTVYDKTLRVRALAQSLGQELGVDDAERAAIAAGAYLAKADLVTQMVHEFPELQGIMGREYARMSGEGAAVAEVILEHHLPRHAGDALPQTNAGRIVSIADKVDTIVGCFGAGLIPTGSQDPYALRRQALGIVRIVLDAGLSLHLGQLLEQAYDLFEVNLTDRKETLVKLHEFFQQRIRGALLEQGIRHDIADAAIAADPHNPALAAAKAKALQLFSVEPEFAALLAAYERVANLVGHAEDVQVVPALFAVDAEVTLHKLTVAAADRLPVLLAAGAHGEALRLLASLRPAVDTLFADVMVMTKEEQVRRNRLALLRRTLGLFHAVARFDLVVVVRR